jgi:predicted GNAT superfamily acetyltransferase
LGVSGDLRIRPLDSIEDFRAAEALQREVWSGSETDVIPLHVLLTVAKGGGLVLGAFDGPVLAGYLFGFLGLVEGGSGAPVTERLKHCSHQLGVRPAYRGRGIGLRLKLEQRECVLGLGLRLITWTYNPMEAGNAILNVARLGGICRAYRRNVYGEMSDALNAGVFSDRFLVEWWITSAHVKARLERPGGKAARRSRLEGHLSRGTPLLNPALDPAPSPQAGEFSGPEALVEIPSDFRELRERDSGLALAWQKQARGIFPPAFAGGYAVTDVVQGEIDGRRRTFYVLSALPLELSIGSEVLP